MTKSTTKAPARYHPLLVTFHWFIALFVFAELVAGFYIKGLPNEPAKWGPLGVHMLVGRTILFLMIVRLITRFVTKNLHLPIQSEGYLTWPPDSSTHFCISASLRRQLQGWAQQRKLG